MRLALVGLQAIIRSMGEIVYVQKHPIEYSRGLSFIRRRSLRRAPGVGQIVMTLEKSNYPLQADIRRHAEPPRDMGRAAKRLQLDVAA